MVLEARLFSIILGLAFCRAQAGAIEVTEFQGAAHGYPAFLDASGKKLADGEFRQWVEGQKLHIVISYRFRDGRYYEENALFRQKPEELIQEQWSWKELRDDRPEREFTIDFLSKKAMMHLSNENQTKEGEVDIEPGRTFAGFGFTIAIVNVRKRLLVGEEIELVGVGFAPKMMAVKVKITHTGVDRLKMAGRTIKGDGFNIHPEVPAIAKLFIKVPDTKLWLTNSTPAAFLRAEGPLVLPSDPIVRIDLLSGGESGAAESIKDTPQ
jgi:hypothetical protein